MSAKLADYLQVWGLEDHHIIFSDGSFGMGFSLHPVDASCWSIEQSNEYAQRLIQFLNGLPPEIDFQFISDIKAGNLELIERHQLSDVSDSEIVNELTSARCEKLTNIDAEGLLPKHGLLFFEARTNKSSF